MTSAFQCQNQPRRRVSSPARDGSGTGAICRSSPLSPGGVAAPRRGRREEVTPCPPAAPACRQERHIDMPRWACLESRCRQGTNDPPLAGTLAADLALWVVSNRRFDDRPFETREARQPVSSRNAGVITTDGTRERLALARRSFSCPGSRSPAALTRWRVSLLAGCRDRRSVPWAMVLLLWRGRLPRGADAPKYANIWGAALPRGSASLAGCNPGPDTPPNRNWRGSDMPRHRR